MQIPNFDPENLGWMIPCGRLGVPSDISRACVFLASDDSKWMYGTMMLVDGGTTAKLALDIDKLGIDFGDVPVN
jgi:NAD(P)-dependent dehydrogenase (short-subunit alcohol dehydrogenase family)